MKQDAELQQALHRHGDTVRRICLMHLNNRSDVEDVFQEVFLKYALRADAFRDEEHERAWLIRVAVNACRDLSRSAWKRRVFSLEEADTSHLSVPPEHREVLDAVLQLEPNYRNVIYLHYYEGYKAAEIGRILGRRENTVYTWLGRARAQLKDRLGGEPHGG